MVQFQTARCKITNIYKLFAKSVNLTLGPGCYVLVCAMKYKNIILLTQLVHSISS